VARDQKVLKFFIRLLMPVLTLGGFGGVWGLVLVGMNQQKIVSGIWSPDKHYRASIVKTSSDDCRAFVLVERQSLFLKTGEFSPFCFAGPPDRVSLQWKDARTLQIECSGCEGNYGYTDEKWGNLTFAYDLDRP